MVTEEERFLDWLAGFVAGDGCFVIRPKTNSKQFQTGLQVQLRDDDLDILLEIQERLGMGVISRYQFKNSSQHKPTAGWSVFRIADTQKLVRIFERHPIRNKKRKDFEIWRDAVTENTKPIKQRNLEKMRYLSEKLKLVRQYDPGEELVYKPEGIQLTLPDYEEDEEED